MKKKPNFAKFSKERLANLREQYDMMDSDTAKEFKKKYPDLVDRIENLKGYKPRSRFFIGNDDFALALSLRLEDEEEDGSYANARDCYLEACY